MTPEHFRALISSSRTADRLMAGREIEANPLSISRPDIETAYHAEIVPRVRRLFAAALQSLDAKASEPAETGLEQAKEIFDEAYLRALRHVSEVLLHQINPLIGDIEQSASQEFEKFEESETKKRIGQIRLQADAVAKLYKAAKPAVFEEFDLATTVRNCLPLDLPHQLCLVSFIGPAPLIAQGDQALVSIAITNGLRNAIESCLSVADPEYKPAIIVSWNETDRDYWVTILDEGIGYHGSVSGAFQIGTSTKNHGGHGLPASKAAMFSLSGVVELIPHKDRGCTYSLSWPKIGSVL